MSAATYEILVTDVTGTPLPGGNLTKTFESLDCSLVVNGVGPLALTLPFDQLRWPLFKAENRIEVWRTPYGGATELLGGKSWIIRRRGFVLPADGPRKITVQAQCCNSILHRRTTAAYDTGVVGYTSLNSAPCDDNMKLLMSTNFGAGATDVTRNIATYLGVEANSSAAPSAQKDCAQAYVDDVLRELAQASDQAGTPLFFNVIWDGMFRFYTRIYQLGRDLRPTGSIGGLVLGPEFKNLTDIEYYEDDTNEANFVYARGQGQGTSRYDATASSAARIARSPIGRTEFFQDCRGSVDAAVQAEADAALRRVAPRYVLNGRIEETDQTRYGVHWRWGDRMVAQVAGLSFDVRADVVHFTKSSAGETINAPLQGITAL